MSHRLSECEQNHLRSANNNSVEAMNEHISGAGGAAPVAESLRAPINHCNNRPISRYLQTREHVFNARTTQSVLTHLDSSTFARPLWAKNIKISFIAASLCVSQRQAASPPVTPRRPNSWSLRDIFILFSLFRGFSEIRASDVIICQSTRALARGPWFIITQRALLHPADCSDLFADRTRGFRDGCVTMSVLIDKVPWTGGPIMCRTGCLITLSRLQCQSTSW